MTARRARQPQLAPGAAQRLRLAKLVLRRDRAAARRFEEDFKIKRLAGQIRFLSSDIQRQEAKR